jgi:autotransporter translocation and assembly factor TamB
MKKIFVIAFLCSIAATPVAAQGWLDILKGAATTAVDKATGGKLTEYALVGTWNYSSPGTKLESTDTAKELGAVLLEAAIAGQLENIYTKAGLKPGVGTVTFAKDGTFSATLGERTISGTYTFDAAKHRIEVTVAKAASIGGNVYLSGTELMLVFPITKAVEMITSLGDNVSSLESISKLLEGYDNIYAGAKFSKK